MDIMPALRPMPGQEKTRSRIVALCRDEIGDHLRQRVMHRVERAAGRRSTRPHGSPRRGIQDASLWQDDRQRSVAAVVRWHIKIAQHGAQSGHGGGETACEGRVEHRTHLCSGTREIEDCGVTRNSHGRRDTHRTRRYSVAVQPRLALPGAIRDCLERGAHASFAVVEHLCHRQLHHVGAEPFCHLTYAAAPNVIGGELCIHITAPDLGRADVGEEEPLYHAAVPVARDINQQRRDDDALLYQFARGGVYPCTAATDVEMMRGAACPTQQSVSMKDRREQDNVVEMLTAAVGIVEHHCLSFGHAREVELFGRGAEGMVQSGGLQGYHFRLRHHAALCIQERGRAIARLAHHGRKGRADKVSRHFVSG